MRTPFTGRFNSGYFVVIDRESIKFLMNDFLIVFFIFTCET